MQRAGWTMMRLACIVVLGAGAASAQVLPAPPPRAPTSAAKTPFTTLSGVYTAEQASRGKDVYAGVCRNCHVPASHTGLTFKKWWAGRLMSELYDYVSIRMPKNEPGSLAPEDYADVVAYLMKMNGMPAGKDELSSDVGDLRKIRIVTPNKLTKGIGKP